MTASAWWRGRMLVLAGLVLVAFSLRTAVASLSPVLDAVQRDFAVPAAVGGLIGTAPPLAYAVFGILTPRLERRWGLVALMTAAVVGICAGLILRAVAIDAVMLVAASFLTFAAIGVGNVLMPPLVRAYFPDRVGLLTTLYSVALAVGTFVPPLVAVPLADAAGWRVSLGVWAVFAAAALLPWIVELLRGPRITGGEESEVTPPRVTARMLRLPLAWAAAVAMAVSAVFAYTAFAWLPQVLTERAGSTPAEAGALLAVFGAVGLPASLCIPMLVTRFRATGAIFVVAILGGCMGVLGLLWAPQAMTTLWVVGLAMPTLMFPLTLVLLGTRTRTHEGAVALSGFVQSVGYGIATVFPFAIGVLHDLADSWTLPLWVLLATLATAIPAGVIAARPHLIEDDWERRYGAW